MIIYSDYWLINNFNCDIKKLLHNTKTRSSELATVRNNRDFSFSCHTRSLSIISVTLFQTSSIRRSEVARISHLSARTVVTPKYESVLFLLRCSYLCRCSALLVGVKPTGRRHNLLLSINCGLSSLLGGARSTRDF